jgi:TatD DNase family protein
VIDSHCHLEPEDFTADGADERDAVLARARAAGLRAFVCVGSGASLKEVHNAVGLAERHRDLWAAVGIHPHEAGRVPDGALDEIERLAATHPRVVAVGETGLDYHYDHAPREAQRALLAHFVGVARRTRKPLSLHIRSSEGKSAPGDAHTEAMEICRAAGIAEVGGVVHCFTGNRDEAARWVALGLHVSFSGIVTFKKAEALREAARHVPDDRLLVETDCPYLAPVPFRGKRNEPAYLPHTVACLAELRGATPEALGRLCATNTRRLFGLPEES